MCLEHMRQTACFLLGACNFPGEAAAEAECLRQARRVLYAKSEKAKKQNSLLWCDNTEKEQRGSGIVNRWVTKVIPLHQHWFFSTPGSARLAVSTMYTSTFLLFFFFSNSTGLFFFFSVAHQHSVCGNVCERSLPRIIIPETHMIAFNWRREQQQTFGANREKWRDERGKKGKRGKER